MNYLLILFLKILENTLATLRIILVSNGKKFLSSILLLLTSVVWITSSSIAITNFDLLMILSFSFGSFFGSYLGSILEEKIAIGNHLVICISNKNIGDYLNKEGYITTKLESYKKQEILLIIIKRKKQKELVKKIKAFDNFAIIVSEYTNIC